MKKKPRIPTHYVQDIEYILYEYIEKIKECRAHQHTPVLRIPEIHARLRKLIDDSSILHNMIMGAKK